MANLVPVEDKKPRLVPVEAGRGQDPVSEREPMTTGEVISGAGQTLLTLGTGAVAEPIAGFAGLLRGAYGGITGEEDILRPMANAVEATREFITVEPFTESGRRVAEKVAVPFQYYMDKAQEKGREDLERTGSPAVATAVQTGMEFLPAAIGMKGVAVIPKRRIRDVTDFAQQEGINISRRGEGLRDQVGEAAKRRADAQRGASSEGIKAVVDRVRTEAKEEINRLYDEARSKRAGIAVENAREFPDLARRSLEDFDVDDMPKVKRRLSELDEIKRLPNDTRVRLQAIEDWRKRINKNTSTDPAEQAALRTLKGTLDTWLDAKFNADMISGDPTALQSWKNARGAVQRYKEQFKDDKVIAQFERVDATPEEIRQWIFGANSVGAKKQASATVKKIKKMVGEDSPEFTALRSDALFDVMQPLFKDDPNLKAFVTKYDRLVSENPSLAKELYGDSLGELKKLRDFASAAVKRGDPITTEGLLTRAGPVLAAGHALAVGSLRVTGLQRLMKMAAEVTNKEKFLKEVFGESITDPMFGRVMRAGATAQSGEELSERESRQPMGAGAQ